MSPLRPLVKAYEWKRDENNKQFSKCSSGHRADKMEMLKWCASIIFKQPFFLFHVQMKSTGRTLLIFLMVINSKLELRASLKGYSRVGIWLAGWNQVADGLLGSQRFAILKAIYIFPSMPRENYWSASYHSNMWGWTNLSWDATTLHIWSVSPNKASSGVAPEQRLSIYDFWLQVEFMDYPNAKFSDNGKSVTDRVCSTTQHRFTSNWN